MHDDSCKLDVGDDYISLILQSGMWFRAMLMEGGDVVRQSQFNSGPKVIVREPYGTATCLL